MKKTIRRTYQNSPVIKTERKGEMGNTFEDFRLKKGY